jgi:RNA polymerase sigma factor (sigma-70 family)
MFHTRPPSHWRSRNERVLRNLPLVRYLAHQVRPCGGTSDVEDLVSAGTVALLEAADHFDSNRGVSFPSFAYSRIKGAMIDETWRLSGRKRGTQHAADVSLQEAVSSEPTLTLIETIADPQSPEPPARAELREVMEGIRRLPLREREILALHTAGHSLAEIAARAGCSEARASGILSRARLRLTERVA